jgi:hypothetical protein
MALITAIIISFVLMSLALAAASRGIMAREEAQLLEEGEAAAAAARGCIALAALASREGRTETSASFGSASCAARSAGGIWHATGISGAATASFFDR